MFSRLCKYLSALAFVLSLSVVASGTELPNLTGTWLLNEKLSDHHGSPQFPGGGGRPGNVGGTRGDLGHEPSAEEEQRMNQVRQENSMLEVYHDGIELNVTNGMDVSRLLFTDGREMTIWTPEGMAQAMASWDKRTLVVQWKTEDDVLSRLRRYTLSVDGLRLTVKEKRRLPDEDKYREITLIYDKKMPPKSQ